jgi:hypothetical protein
MKEHASMNAQTNIQELRTELLEKTFLFVRGMKIEVQDGGDGVCVCRMCVTGVCIHALPSNGEDEIQRAVCAYARLGGCAGEAVAAHGSR